MLADLSRFHALAEENDQALRVGLEAVEMARQFGLAEVEARALNNVGTAKCHLWDLSGLDDLRRSIEIALAANSPEAARGHNNLGSFLWEIGDMQESFDQFRAAVSVGERLGNAIVTDYAGVIVIEQEFWLGRWDEALPSYDDLLAKWESGDGHYLENAVRIDRAIIRVARGDRLGAVEDVRRAIEQARKAKDPQALLPTLASAAHLFSELGLVDEARQAAEEALSDDRSGGLLFGLIELAFVADSVGVRETLRQHVERLPDLTRWRRVAELLLDGDFEAAAETFDALPLPLYAARARLAAAEQLVAQGQRAQADHQLQAALAFFRSVKTTRYIAEAESLLTASA